MKLICLGENKYSNTNFKSKKILKTRKKDSDSWRNAPDLSIKWLHIRKRENMHIEKRLKGMSINETFIQLGDYGI